MASHGGDDEGKRFMFPYEGGKFSQDHVHICYFTSAAGEDDAHPRPDPAGDFFTCQFSSERSGNIFDRHVWIDSMLMIGVFHRKTQILATSCKPNISLEADVPFRAAQLIYQVSCNARI